MTGWVNRYEGALVAERTSCAASVASTLMAVGTYGFQVGSGHVSHALEAATMMYGAAGGAVVAVVLIWRLLGHIGLVTTECRNRSLDRISRQYLLSSDYTWGDDMLIVMMLARAVIFSPLLWPIGVVLEFGTRLYQAYEPEPQAA